MASKQAMTMALFLLNALALVLALAAEFKRSTAKATVDAQFMYTYCVYTSSISTLLGIGSAVILLASQALLMAATHCLCRPKTLAAGTSKFCAIVLFVLCWLAFLGSEMFLVAGSVVNAQRTKYRAFFGADWVSCRTLSRGVFGFGAGLVLVLSVLSQLYLHCYYIAKGSFEIGDECDDLVIEEEKVNVLEKKLLAHSQNA